MLLTEKERTSDLKVCDFGLSAQIPRGALDWGDKDAVKAYKGLSDKWGTPQYFAPEMLWKAYGPQVGRRPWPSLSGTGSPGPLSPESAHATHHTALPVPVRTCTHTHTAVHAVSLACLCFPCARARRSTFGPSAWCSELLTLPSI